MDASITVRLIDETRAGFNRIQGELNDLDRTNRRLGDGFRNLQSAAVGFISAIGVREVGSFITSIQNMDNRLRLVTGTTEGVNKTFDALLKVAQDTRTPIQANVDLFSKLGQNLDILGKTQEDLTDIVKAFNLSLTISGTTGMAASAAILQFSQAMQSGRLNGDEFRTMLEQNPKFLQVLSKYTTIAREDLKKFASEGLLNSKVIAQALMDALPELAAEHDKLSRTVGGATTQMINEYTRLGRQFLDTTDTANTLVKAIDHFRLSAESILVVLEAVGIGVLLLITRANPLMAAFTALSAVFLYFADDVAPMFRTALDFIYKVVLDTVGVFGALIDAVKAVINLEDPFEAFHKGVKEYSKESKLANFEITEFNRKVHETKDATEQANGPSARMAELLDETGITARKTKSAYDDYIKTLQENIATTRLDEEGKRIAINVNKALEAAAKDLGKTVEQLSDERKNQITAEVTAITSQLVREEEISKRRKELLEFQQKSFEKYDKFIEENQVRGLSRLETYIAAEEEIRQDFRMGLVRDEQQLNEALTALKTNFQTTMLKDLNDYIEEQKTAEEKFRDASAELTEIYQAGLIDGEAQFQTMLLALRNKYGKEWSDKAKEYRDADRSETEKYHEDLLDLEDAVNAGLIAKTEDVAVIRAGIEKEYRDGLITEYNSLYGFLGKKLEELTGVTREQLGITRDIFKLVFGVDINDILKQAFAEFIKYIIGFRKAGDTEITGFSGIFKKIFGQGGEASKEVQVFSGEGTDILSQMVGGVGSLFGGLVDIFKSVFGSGLSIIGEFASSAMSILKDIGGGIGDWVTGLFKGGGGSGNFFGDLIDGVMDFGGDFFGSIADFGSDLFGGATDFLKNIPGVSDIMNFGSDLFGDITKLFDFGGGGGGNFFGTAGSFLGNIGMVGIGADLLTKTVTGIFGDDIVLSPQAAEQKRLNKAAEPTRQLRAQIAGSNKMLIDAESIFHKQGLSIMGNKVIRTSGGRDEVLQTRNFDHTAIKQFMVQNNIGGSVSDFLPYYVMSGETQFGANGLAFDSGSVKRYAMGGIIDRPTVFGTNTGLAIGGEAGTEAILPLERTSDGRLGVSAVGGDININFTINAVDSDGIDRLLADKRQYITNMVRAAVYEKGRSLI